MRTKSTICILALATAFAGAHQAQAGDKEKYLIGGLLGGWILNAAVHDSAREHVRSYPSVTIRSTSCSSGRYDRHDRPSGRYEYRRVKVWVPGYHERVRSHCGRTETRWVSGHYDYRTEKVWVSYESSHSRSRGHNRHSSRY